LGLVERPSVFAMEKQDEVCDHMSRAETTSPPVQGDDEVGAGISVKVDKMDIAKPEEDGTRELHHSETKARAPEEDESSSSDESSVDLEEEYREKLRKAKRAARSEIKVSEWGQYNFASLDLDKALGPPANNIERIHCKDVSPEEFVQRFELPAKPCIIRGLLDEWPAYKEGKSKWSFQGLQDRFGDVRLKCGEDDDGYKVKLRLDHFVRYVEEQKDDAPLYIFDADFGDEGKPTIPLLDDFSMPPYFAEDLYSLVGEKRRPPYRWMLLGPKRSGSSMHIDPLATSAWNSIISGRKRWVLFPPGMPKSVVKPKAWMDKPDREAIDWFLLHYKDVKKGLPSHEEPIELEMGAGETIYVPGGWWHTVLNLEDSVAVTQNFCSTTSFPAVWQDSVTGRTKLSRSWLKVLQTTRPDLYTIAQSLAGSGDGRTTAEEELDSIVKDRREKKEKKKAKKRARKDAKKSSRD